MSATDRVVDPVCGMLIHPAAAAGTRTYREILYHLCSSRCLAKFDTDGEAYIAAAGRPEFRTWVAKVLTDVNSAFTALPPTAPP